MISPAPTQSFRARAYFYLDPPAANDEARAFTPPAVRFRAREPEPDVTESQFLDFLHDSRHRYDEIAVPDRSEEWALRVLQHKYPGHTVCLMSLTWLK